MNSTQIYTIEKLNTLSEVDFITLMLNNCHSQCWAENMLQARPFSCVSDFLKAAESIWAKSGEMDILEAFSGHAKIGDIEALRNKFALQARSEQGQVVEANNDVLLNLQRCNEEYEKNFGFIFIVCATGKTASEMLSIIEKRIRNTREKELHNGADEQAKITALRLNKLLGFL